MIVNVASLTRAAETFSAELETLPFITLEEAMMELGINILEITGKDTIIAFHRKGGLAKPYSSTTAVENFYSSEVGKAVQRSLEVQPCVVVFKDFIDSYKDKKVITNAGEKVNNQDKNHPLEKLILDSIVKTGSEDMISTTCHGERDEADLSPIGMFDGMNKIIDDDISAGRISAALKNYIVLGTSPFVAPADTLNPTTNTTAWDNLVKFIKNVNPYLRKNGMLYIPYNILQNCMDACAIAMAYKPNVMSYDVFLAALQSKVMSKNLRICSHEALGTGDRITMQLPGNMDLGMNTKSDKGFVQVRAPFENPNLIQFWMQWEAGFRVRSVHAKVFAVSDGTPVADLELAGDYQS